MKEESQVHSSENLITDNLDEYIAIEDYSDLKRMKRKPYRYVIPRGIMPDDAYIAYVEYRHFSGNSLNEDNKPFAEAAATRFQEIIPFHPQELIDRGRELENIWNSPINSKE